MKQIHKNSRLAGAAIAAVLALGSTPSFAQDAGATQGSGTAPPPVIMVPPVSAPAATTQQPIATPQAVAPAQDPQLLNRLVIEPPTNVRAEPVQRAERTEPRAQRATAARAEAVPTASGPAATSTPAAPSAETGMTTVPADALPAASYQPVPVAEPASVDPVPVQQGNDFAAILAALLGVGIAGVGGFLVMGALRRRRQRMADIEEPVRYEVQREPGAPRRRLSESLRDETQPTAQPAPRVQPVSQPYAPSAATLAAAGKQEAPRPFVATRLASEQRGTMDAPSARMGSASLNRDSSVTPAPLPVDPEKREELIQQIVEAEPDRVNPFLSRKARRRRARLILQSLQRRFDNARPNFDIAKFCRDWNIMPPRGYSPA